MRAQPFWAIVGSSSLAQWRHWLVCVCLQLEEATFTVDKLNQQRDAFMKARATFDRERQQAAEAWHKRNEDRIRDRSTSTVRHGQFYTSQGTTFGVGNGMITASVLTGLSGYGPMVTSTMRPAPWKSRSLHGDDPVAQAEWKADDEKLRSHLRRLVTSLEMMDRRFPWVRRDLETPTYTIEATTDDPNTPPGPEDW